MQGKLGIIFTAPNSTVIRKILIGSKKFLDLLQKTTTPSKKRCNT
jgi:hypothetical protein